MTSLTIVKVNLKSVTMSVVQQWAEEKLQNKVPLFTPPHFLFYLLNKLTLD